MAVIINKGQRGYDVRTNKDGSKVILEAGASLEVSAEEAKRLLNYHDIVDASEAVPQNAQEIERLKAENARLKTEQEALRENAPAAKVKEKEPPIKPVKASKPAKKWAPLNKKKGKK